MSVALIRRSTRLAGALAAAAILAVAPLAAQEAAPATCGGTDLMAKAQAQEPEKFAAFVASAGKIPNAEGLLWRVTKDGVAPSYLFGTMHTTEADLVDLAPPVRSAIADSRTIAVELADANGPEAQAEMVGYVTANAFDPASKGLEGLDEAQVAEVKRRLAETGLPAEAVPLLKPWFIGLTLQISPCVTRQIGAGKPTVDATVEKIARDGGKTVVGLEKIKEQLEAASSVQDDAARRMIRDAVATKSSSDDLQATTLALYRGRKVGWYFAMDEATFGAALDVSAYADFLEVIVDKRNRLMLERSSDLLKAGAVTIAVGALHMPGKNGLIELIRAQGYKVERIW